MIEKPLAPDLCGLDELEHVVARRQLTALVGFQFRFNPGLHQIKQWIGSGAIGEVVSAQAHWGEYLPAMHPWEDYRAGYAAREALGGGVLNTLCHPFDYLRWLLGDVTRVTAVESRSDALGLSVDTSVDVALAFASGAHGHVHLDFFQQPREHRLRIVGTEGTATWNDSDHAARRYDRQTQRIEHVPPPTGFDRNAMFLDEMRHFLACLRGEARPRCTLRDGRASVEIVQSARRAMGSAAGPVETK
jgi:predicted dehydrogenase